MTDRPQKTGRTQDGAPGATVETLASQAIMALASKRSNDRPVLSERLVGDLIKAALHPDDTLIDKALAAIPRAGIPADEVLGFYVPEAARRLGEAWCSDGIGFADVTISVARLQRALRLWARANYSPPQRDSDDTSILIAVIADDFHTLGAMVMTEQLRRAGVSVRLCLGETPRSIARIVAEGSFDAMLLSVAIVEKLAEVRDLVEKTRAASKGKLPIAVGGAVCGSGLDVKRLTGADFSSSDAFEALRLCGLTILPQGARPRAASA